MIPYPRLYPEPSGQPRKIKNPGAFLPTMSSPDFGKSGDKIRARFRNRKMGELILK